jgi:lysophospholipase L1-like esterase
MGVTSRPPSAAHRVAAPLRRYVAIGDSLTLGAGDPDPSGRPRGFADLLAAALGQRGDALSYANLARPSVRAAEVAAQQVPGAVTLRPHLVTAVAGVNDVIAARFRPDVTADALDRLLGDLRRGCPDALIVTATMPDLTQVSALARRWRHRVAALDAAVRAAAASHGAVVVDLAAGGPMRREDLALDRAHPSPEGHLRIARAVGEALGLAVARPAHMAAPPSAPALRRAYRTAVVAPTFLARRVARRSLITRQAPKRPDLHPL